ncbi:glutathione S-transferase family protein [Halieaceae bacterium IMCC14734]|uniref:Glutathione S-transferase family protein n=1 Tax=Candidatus Litorirhabdus singularis TaxID=2518993 RepID=A0ABT3TMP2_9GAMM|nr:glutathione S-transferase family protein [Candidatus Litorirhabdus singularis]MCX2982592.1 glutathione S-transferase family protein [Candidatus Litorirhabdus singularis]
MLTIHHLRIGRSIFAVWLLEELELDYQLKEYLRNPETMRAPPELKLIHPLGKSPVIEEDGLVLSESGAITSYLLEKYDTNHRFSPPRSDLSAWAEYTQWLHYAEGSVFTPLMLKMIALRSGEPQPLLDGFGDPEIALHFGHISQQLGDNEFILGDRFSGADFGISYMVGMAQALGQLEPYPSLAAYLERNQARPAYQRALERGVE